MDQTRFCGRAQTGYDFIKLDPWYRVLDLDEVDEISATITLRWMEESDLGRLGDLDRLETVRTGYQVQDGNLTSHTIGWDVPSFFVEGDGEHSIAEQIRFCRSHLAHLHVSAGYRRPGIAAHSVQGLFKAASDGGARQISVSAMPSESAVGFYLARGFSPVDEPLPELYELERDDIHMIRDL